MGRRAGDGGGWGAGLAEVSEELKGFFGAEAATGGVGFQRGRGEPADIGVGCCGVCEDESADAGVGNHGAGLREPDAQPRGAGQQGEDVALEGMVRAGGVTGGGLDDPDRRSGHGSVVRLGSGLELPVELRIEPAGGRFGQRQAQAAFQQGIVVHAACFAGASGGVSGGPVRGSPNGGTWISVHSVGIGAGGDGGGVGGPFPRDNGVWMKVTNK